MFRTYLKQFFAGNTPQAPAGPVAPKVYEVGQDDPCIPVGADFPCRDVELLNPVQSCFKQNYNPENNCVVVSGMGSGKTFVAYIGGSCYLNEGKRVAILATTRDLCTQLYDDAVADFGRPMVGQYRGNDKSVEGKYVIVTTPEGYLSGLRGNREWANQIDLMIVDEADLLLDSSRGGSLDVAMTLCRQKGGKLLLMSGTFPSAKEVSLHLNAELFISSFERTQILKTEIHSPDDLEAMEAPKKPPDTSVLTASGYIYNKDSVRLQDLKKELEQLTDDSVIIFVPTKAQGYCLSAALRVPFHCKDLPEDEKKDVIAGFKTGRIKRVIATDTLARGINTPADVVIIFGLRRGGYYLDSSAVKQRAARAGRNKDNGRVIILGDKAEIFHSKKEIFTKTLPLPTEQMLMTVLSRGSATQEELRSKLLQTYAASLMEKGKVEEAVDRYLRYLSACNILREKNGEYRLTEEGVLLARFFISPGAYIGYVKLARELKHLDFTDTEKGCLLLQSLLHNLPARDCSSRYEKDFKMKIVKLQMEGKLDMDVAKDLNPTKASMLRQYLEKPSSIPQYFGANIMDMDRWLSLLSEMERYKVHVETPGKQWLQGLIFGLKGNILKAVNKKKPSQPVQMPLNNFHAT